MTRILFLVIGIAIGAWGSSEPQLNPYVDPLILRIVPDNAFDMPVWEI